MGDQSERNIRVKVVVRLVLSHILHLSRQADPQQEEFALINFSQPKSDDIHLLPEPQVIGVIKANRATFLPGAQTAIPDIFAVARSQLAEGNIHVSRPFINRLNQTLVVGDKVGRWAFYDRDKFGFHREFKPA